MGEEVQTVGEPGVEGEQEEDVVPTSTFCSCIIALCRREYSLGMLSLLIPKG